MANHFTAKNKFLYKEFVVKYPSCLPSFMKKKKNVKKDQQKFPFPAHLEKPKPLSGQSTQWPTAPEVPPNKYLPEFHFSISVEYYNPSSSIQ